MTVKSGVTISGDFIVHVRRCYWQGLEAIIKGGSVRVGVNGYTDWALSAYITSVAAVEAFVNEAFLSFAARPQFQHLTLGALDEDWLNRLDVLEKLVLVPQLLFCSSFRTGVQPYQDMSTLVHVRNGLVHYKMKADQPKYVETLERKGVALTTGDPNGDFAWPHKLSSTEGIRWAHNTACNTVRALVEFATLPALRQIAESLALNFGLIPESEARDWLKQHGIDPDSTNR